jgi:pimeloyl-ACP methyl ester carboxylesterase
VPEQRAVMAEEFAAHFLGALHAVRTEVEERLPGYFGYHALRVRMPHDASSDAAFEDLFERIGMVYDLSLLAVPEHEQLNAVDELFEQRLSCSPGELADRAAGLDEVAQPAWLEAVAAEQDATRRARDERVAGMPGSLERHAFETADGDTLVYHAAGSRGDVPIVLLNALGQGLHYWFRLIDVLMRGNRVIVWETRGTHAADRPFGLGDQVDDLEAILDHEGAETCRLVGWCTGGKVAVELYRRHPERVASIVFLNSAFKWEGGPGELESDYERNLEPVCRAIARRPEMAASMTGLLGVGAEQVSVDSLDDDSGAVATQVVAMTNRDLGPLVTAPFRTESSTVNYARQSLDFWAYDATAEADRMQAPVLFVSAEHDAVSSPAMARAMAARYPGSRHVEVLGATHYCLYDRPDLVADLVESFAADPDGLSRFEGHMDLRVTPAAERAGR